MFSGVPRVIQGQTLGLAPFLTVKTMDACLIYTLDDKVIG